MNKSQKIKELPDYLSTTDIGKRLGIHLTQEFIIQELGIEPEVKTKTGSFWHQHTFKLVCIRLAAYALFKNEDEYMSEHRK